MTCRLDNAGHRRRRAGDRRAGGGVAVQGWNPAGAGWQRHGGTGSQLGACCLKWGTGADCALSALLPLASLATLVCHDLEYRLASVAVIAIALGTRIARWTACVGLMVGTVALVWVAQGLVRV